MARKGDKPANRSAQVHRFHEFIGCYLGNGGTVYLTPKEARAIARALNGCARSVTKEARFSEHTFGTFWLELQPNRMTDREG